MIIEISVGIIALAFVILVIYLVLTLQALRTTLNQVNHTLLSARKHVDELSEEANQVIQQSMAIGLNVHEKMESLNSLFNTISNVGNALENVTASLNSQSTLKPESATQFAEQQKAAKESESKIVEIIEWAVLALSLWQKIKKRR